ncbi:MAG: hypothetical protein Q7J82_07060 [Coriobacteriia bacterium]|nr:hypothetical protein [Coriobacteriia bacterium]
MSWELDENGFYRQPLQQELKVRAAATKQRLANATQSLSPITMPEGGRTRIVSTWWSDAWCSNLASYADLQNRVARGRKYLRADAVIDLQVATGRIAALVQGSVVEPYRVQIEIQTLDENRCRDIQRYCAERMTGLETLMAGALPQELADLFTDSRTGLFPLEQELNPCCSCPDVAWVCKHTFAVLYGVGSRLDDNPLLLFQLRGIDVAELISKSVDARVSSLLERANEAGHTDLDDDDLKGTFGL